MALRQVLPREAERLRPDHRRGVPLVDVVGQPGHVGHRDAGHDLEAAGAAREAYAELVRQATDRTPDPGELGGMSAYQMAATVEFGLDAKQGLLDLRSETARMKLVTRLFRAAVRRLDYVERAQARARSNGKVNFSG